MAFHTADYDVYVALGDLEVPALWNWKVWQRFLPSIDPLIQATRGKAAVRSLQYLPDAAGEVKLGRLGWSESDHQKWCHGSPTNKKESKSWSFENVEVWAPGWTVCSREDLAPDLFLSITNESQGDDDRRKRKFTSVVLLAVATKFARRDPSLVLAAVSALRKLSANKVIGFRKRPWGKSCGSDGFTDSIQDMAMMGLFKPGQRHKGEAGLQLLSGKWTPVSPE